MMADLGQPCRRSAKNYAAFGPACRACAPREVHHLTLVSTVPDGLGMFRVQGLIFRVRV